VSEPKIIDRRAGRGDPAGDGEGSRQLRRREERESERRAERRERDNGGIGLGDYFVGEGETRPVRRGELLNLLGMFAQHVHEHYSWRGRVQLWAKRVYYGLRHGVWYEGPSLFAIARDVHNLNVRARQDAAKQQAAQAAAQAAAP
jgi:hypothetical protein